MKQGNNCFVDVETIDFESAEDVINNINNAIEIIKKNKIENNIIEDIIKDAKLVVIPEEQKKEIIKRTEKIKKSYNALDL